MSNNKYYVSWFEIQNLVNELAFKLHSFNATDIVGIGKGGLIPAVMLANKLNIQKVYNYATFSYSPDNKQHKIFTYQCPEQLIKKRIIIVDDLLDSGKTMKYVKDGLIENHIITATLYTKSTAEKTADHITASDTCSDAWLVFPWEVV